VHQVGFSLHGYIGVYSQQNIKKFGDCMHTHLMCPKTVWRLYAHTSHVF